MNICTGVWTNHSSWSQSNWWTWQICSQQTRMWRNHRIIHKRVKMLILTRNAIRKSSLLDGRVQSLFCTLHSKRQMRGVNRNLLKQPPLCWWKLKARLLMISAVAELTVWTTSNRYRCRQVVVPRAFSTKRRIPCETHLVVRNLSFLTCCETRICLKRTESKTFTFTSLSSISTKGSSWVSRGTKASRARCVAHLADKNAPTHCPRTQVCRTRRSKATTMSFSEYFV